MDAFGGPVRFFTGDAADGTSATSPEEDMERVRRDLFAVNDGSPGSLRIFRPRPTAAFAPRDTTLSEYRWALEVLRDMGFAPVERRAGGQLAVYDETALVIDLVAPHPEPRLDVLERFRVFSGAIAGALRSFSIDARVGSVSGEYCPGDYSVNGEGRLKLAGVAQRIGRRGYHLGAVVAIERSASVMDAVAKAYRIYGFDFDPRSFGAVADLTGSVSFGDVRTALLKKVARCLSQPVSTTASASISTS